MTVVRAALVQTNWTGDKESVIAAHEDYARQAEAIPGPTTERFQELAKELKMVMVLPMYEEEQPGVLYNTAAVVDADGTYLGKYRKQHIPHVSGFWEKFYFRPGNGGYPVFDTAVGKIGVYICYDRHFPEGWRALGRRIVLNHPGSHVRPLPAQGGDCSRLRRRYCYLRPGWTHRNRLSQNPPCEHGPFGVGGFCHRRPCRHRAFARQGRC